MKECHFEKEMDMTHLSYELVSSKAPGMKVNPPPENITGVTWSGRTSLPESMTPKMQSIIAVLCYAAMILGTPAISVLCSCRAFLVTHFCCGNLLNSLLTLRVFECAMMRVAHTDPWLYQ